MGNEIKKVEGVMSKSNFPGKYFHILIIAYLLIGANSSFGAVIEKMSGKICSFSLSGEIVPGDLGRFKDMFGMSTLSGSSENIALCLDSPGGSLMEAMKIAEYVRDSGIPTVIPAKASCMSACAWIFMFGYVRVSPEAEWVSRSMHYSGRLSFHAPSLNMGAEDKIPTAVAESAIDTIISATAALIRLSNTSKGPFDTAPTVRPDLIQLAFSYTGEDFFEVETVYDAGIFDISVFGYDKPKFLDYRDAVNVCNNIGSLWVRGWSGEYRGQEYQEPWNLLNVTDRADQSTAELMVVEGKDSGYVYHECAVSTVITDGFVRVCGYNQSLGLTFGDIRGDDISECEMGTGSNFIAYSDLATFAPNVLLSEIPNILSRRGKAVDDLKLYFPEGRRYCWLENENPIIVGVKSFANLRQLPAMNSTIIGTVLSGEKININISTATFAQAAERAQECFNVCMSQISGDSFSDKDQLTVNQCIDENLIWYEVNENGRGWISRKFLH